MLLQKKIDRRELEVYLGLSAQQLNVVIKTVNPKWEMSNQCIPLGTVLLALKASVKPSVFFENQIEDEKFLDSNEAASLLSVAKGTLYNYVSNGTVSVYKLGRKNLFKKSDLFNLIEPKKIGG